METTITLVSKMLAYPFALFKNEDCIFESEIDNAYSLKSLMKHIGQKATSNTISIKHFRGLILFAIKLQLQSADYTLITILSEHATNPWSDSDWQLFYKQLQTVSYLLSIEETFPIKLVDEHNTLDKQTETTKNLTTHSDINTDFQDNYQLEISLLSLFKTGDLKAIRLLLTKLISINNSQLSDDILTDSKYKLVVLITLLTRTSIKQGCSANLAFRLSDSLIQSLDKLIKEQDIPLFTEHILIEYSNLNRNIPNTYTSELVNSAIVFIHDNLYDILSNYEIANCLSVHPAYISSLFKKTTGTSLHHYIIRERISEAQYLLANTDLSFSVISERLHFSNQSHFCKLFKAHTNYTPSEFRLWFQMLV